MARRKASARIQPIQRAGAPRRRAWDEQFLGDNRYNPRDTIGSMPGQNNRQSLLDVTAARQQADKLTGEVLAHELTLAFNGDDSELLPYQPTPTINPGRPRTLAAGYDDRSMTLRVKYRDGEYYTYYQVPPSVWYKFQRATSPGRFINSTLNNYPYSRGLS